MLIGHWSLSGRYQVIGNFSYNGLPYCFGAFLFDKNYLLSCGFVLNVPDCASTTSGFHSVSTCKNAKFNSVTSSYRSTGQGSCVHSWPKEAHRRHLKLALGHRTVDTFFFFLSTIYIQCTYKSQCVKNLKEAYFHTKRQSLQLINIKYGTAFGRLKLRYLY